MALRTVRLDDDTERTLLELRERTGLPISEALKLGLRTLAERVRLEGSSRPYDIYRELDLGPGGYAIAPSTDVRKAVKSALERKRLRRAPRARRG
jgi:hypothetical protein